MFKNFQCTACGKCCYGLLPLTWKDACTHASLFPLCFVWTPVRQGSKDFAQIAKIGVTIRLPDKKKLAVIITPTSYIPSSFTCPALSEDNLCKIHSVKPSRCKTMPFYPYREERFQDELLSPRPGWECDVSSNAPIVFENNKIIFRDDFDSERKDLLDQVVLLRKYSDYMIKYYPQLIGNLVNASNRPKSGHVITSLSSFLTATRCSESKQIAKKQLPVLSAFAERTFADTSLIDFHKNYTNWFREMTYLSQSDKML